MINTIISYHNYNTVAPYFKNILSDSLHAGVHTEVFVQILVLGSRTIYHNMRNLLFCFGTYFTVRCITRNTSVPIKIIKVLWPNRYDEPTTKWNDNKKRHEGNRALTIKREKAN